MKLLNRVVPWYILVFFLKGWNIAGAPVKAIMSGGGVQKYTYTAISMHKKSKINIVFENFFLQLIMCFYIVSQTNHKQIRFSKIFIF